MSQEVGEIICKNAGLKKVTMELGSNSPLAVLPDADKQTGYPYGTLLECIGTTYKKSVGTGTTLERGIQYNVQKTSSKGTNAVMGAYANRYSTFYEQGDTLPTGKVIGDEKVVDKPLHQVYILGDGHILCNNSGGNITYLF